MIEKFLIVPDQSERLPVTTIEGLKKEIYTSVLRYFAPVAAIYEQFEKTAGIPTVWQRRKRGENRADAQGPIV
jgi:hypothetical protein